MPMIIVVQTLGLFVFATMAEITGCFLVYRWLRQDGSVWLTIPGAISLGLFAYLLALHPGAAGRTYRLRRGVRGVRGVLVMADRGPAPDRMGPDRRSNVSAGDGDHRPRCTRLLIGRVTLNLHLGLEP